MIGRFLLGLLAAGAGAEPRVAEPFRLSLAPFGLSLPQSAAVDSARREVWVTGYYSASVVVIDEASRKPVAAVGDLLYPAALAVDSAAGRVYVVGNNTLHVLDAAQRRALASHSLGSFYASAMALDPAGSSLYLYGTAYVSGQQVMRLARHDPATGALLAHRDFPASHYGNQLAASAAKVFLGVNIYSSTSSAYASEILALDAADLSVSQRVVLGAEYLYSLALDPPSQRLYAATSLRLWLVKPDAAGALVKASSAAASGVLWDLAVDGAAGRLYAADRFQNRVQVRDAGTLAALKNVLAGRAPSGIALDPGLGLGWVANQASNDVSALDLKTQSLAATVDLRRHEPRALALAPDTGRILAACGVTGAMVTFNPATRAVESVVPELDSPPNAVAYFPALRKAFIQSGQSPNGYLKKLHHDASTTQSVPYSFWGLAGLSAQREANRLLALLGNIPGAPYGRSGVAVLDALTEFPLATIPVGLSSDLPRDVAANPATGKAYVALYAAHQVQVVDLASNQALKRVPVGFYPSAVAVNPNLNRAYVANYGSNSLSVIDGSCDCVVANVPVGPAPKAVAVKVRGARVYVANSGDGTVTVLDGRSLATVATLPSGGMARQLVAEESADRVYGADASGAAITVIEDPAAPAAAPVVSHVPVQGPFAEDRDVLIEAQVTDDSGAPVVTLTYWEPGRPAYYTVPMAAQGGSKYRGIIPADFLLSLQWGRVAYFIDASDPDGNGPPTGQTPGTAQAPNEFAVTKSLVRLWSHSFGRVFGGFYRMVPGPSPAIGDIRPDLSGLEVASGNEEFHPLGAGPSGRWFLFSSTGGVVFWKDTENDEAHSSVNLFDLDGDGNPEMLGGTTSGNQLQAWDRLGRWVWRYVLGSHHVSTPAADRLKPGDPPRVFGGSFDSNLRCLNGADGSLAWAYPAGSWIWSSPAVADLDGDGLKEVVVGADQYASGSANLHVLDAATGAPRWKAVLGGHVRASAALADMDGDGVLEVLIGAPDGIFRAFHGKTGQVLWTYKTGGEIVSSAAVGDLDGDGRLEAVFGSADGRLHCLGAGGVPRWSAALGSPVLGSPALARRVPGAGLDVYVTAAGGVLHLVRGSDGKRLAGFGVGAGVVSSPVVGDVDGDGRLEIFFSDRFGDTTGLMAGDVFWAVRDTGSQVPAFAREWPLFRRDPAHTGLYPAEAPPPAAGPPTPPPDAAPPISKILAPPGATAISTTTLSISGTAEDAESGVSQVEIRLEDVETAQETWWPALGTATFKLSVTGLKDFHSYQLASRATDKAGNVESPAQAVLVRVDLPPSQVQGLQAQAPASGRGELLVSWTPGPEKDLAGYKLYRDDIFLLSLSSPAYRDAGLADGATYAYRVNAVDVAGQAGPSSKEAKGVTNPAPPPPAGAAPPPEPPSQGAGRCHIHSPQEGKTLWGDAVTLVGRADEATARVVFQYRRESSQAWTDIIGDARRPFTIYWNVADGVHETGPYRLRCVAYDAQDRPDPAPPERSVVLDDANADIVEDGNPEVDPNKPHRVTARVDPGRQETLSLADGTAVTVPAGAVPEPDSLEIKSVAAAAAPPIASRHALLKSAGVFRELSFASGRRRFSSMITVSLPAPDEDGNGQVDGSKTKVSDLKPYYFAETSRWEPLAASSQAAPALLSAGGASAVSFQTDHFTLFGLFEELEKDLSLSLGEVYAFPNPARTGQNPTFHVEAGWADSVKIRVYDAAGQLVHQVELPGPPQAVDDGQGLEQAFEYRWDVSGVPSGVYRFVVTARQSGAGSASKAGTCAIIR